MTYTLKYRLNGRVVMRSFNTAVRRDTYAAVLVTNGVRCTCGAKRSATA